MTLGIIITTGIFFILLFGLCFGIIERGRDQDLESHKQHLALLEYSRMQDQVTYRDLLDKAMHFGTSMFQLYLAGLQTLADQASRASQQAHHCRNDYEIIAEEIPPGDPDEDEDQDEEDTEEKEFPDE